MRRNERAFAPRKKKVKNSGRHMNGKNISLETKTSSVTGSSGSLEFEHSLDVLVFGDLAVAIEVKDFHEPVSSFLSLSLFGASEVSKVEGDNLGSVDVTIRVGVDGGELFVEEGLGGGSVAGE